MINFLLLLLVGCVLWYIITYILAMVIEDPKVLKICKIILALIALIVIINYGWPYLGDNSANYHLFHSR